MTKEAVKTEAKKTRKKAKTVPVKERRAMETAKKAAQRQAKRDRGLREISVWVLPEQAQEVRDFADSLPKPPEGSTPAQVQRFRDDLFPLLKRINEEKDKDRGQSDGQTGLQS